MRGISGFRSLRRQGRNKGVIISRALNQYGGGEGSQRLNNVTSTFFNTVHLLPKDFSFKHGGAKLLARELSNLITPLFLDTNGFAK